MTEYVLYATKKGDEDWQEEIIAVDYQACNGFGNDGDQADTRSKGLQPHSCRRG